jgi:hypothetical protein
LSFLTQPFDESSVECGQVRVEPEVDRREQPPTLTEIQRITLSIALPGRNVILSPLVFFLLPNGV